MKIYAQNYGSLNEEDRLEIARLLVKAGYIVRLGKEKQGNKNSYTHYVEYAEGESNG